MTQAKKTSDIPKAHMQLVRDQPQSLADDGDQLEPRSSIGKFLNAFANDIDRQIEEILRS